MKTVKTVKICFFENILFQAEEKACYYTGMHIFISSGVWNGKQKNKSKSHCHCINPDNPDRQPTNTFSSSSCMNQKPHQNPSPKSSQQSNPPRKSFENESRSTRFNTHTRKEKKGSSTHPQGSQSKANSPLLRVQPFLDCTKLVVLQWPQVLGDEADEAAAAIGDDHRRRKPKKTTRHRGREQNLDARFYTHQMSAKRHEGSSVTTPTLEPCTLILTWIHVGSSEFANMCYF